MTTRKIVLKKVKVGTPIKTVTAGSFGINNLGGVDTTGRTTGSLLAFNQSSGNFEPVTLTGDSNHFLTFDSSGTPDTLQINFTNDSISGSLIPKLDSAFDLGSSTKKWKDLFLSGSTITLGDLTIQSTGGGIEVKDSDGNTLLQNIKYITVNGDTDILAYDSNTSTFTFNDSDIARTDETETFHKNIIVADSANIAGNLTVGGNVSITGDLQYDDVSADSGVFSGSVVIGNNLTADSSTINKIANTTLTGQNATFDSATIGNLAVTNLVISSGDSAFFSKVGVGDLEVDSANIDRLTLDSGQVRQLSTGFINADSAFMDSATISTIATGTINADQQFTDSATITNIANSVLTAKVITNTTLTNATLTSDSATIGNVAVTTQLTGNQANFDSVASNTLHATNLSVDSGDIRQLSVDFINADSAFFDSATITNLSTTQITFSQATLDSATINTLNADSSDIRQFSTEFINFDSAFGDSATITNIANTQLTGSQATLDSATITKLNVDSSDIDHLSTEAINFDSATGDSATITNIANSVLTAKAITGTSADIDSATIGNIAITNAVISSGDSATITNIANSVLTAKAITGTSADIDSATIGNIAATTINVDNINIGDSATFTNLATTQFTGSQATLDSATITKLNVDSADIDHFSTENINFDSATGDSATITNLANSTLTAKVITNTTLVGDSATITNIANDVLTAKAITNTTQVGDSATITNIANSVLTAKAITNTTQVGDSATITNIANSVLTAKAITNTTQVGDSATITNIANSVLTAKAITGTTVTTSGDIVSSGTIRAGNLNVDSADIDTIAKASLLGGTGVTYDSSSGVIAIGQPVGTTDSVTFSGLTIGGNLVVSGTTTTVATTNTTMTDQLFELGNGRTGSPSGDAGVVIEMGDDSNAFMGFDQSLGKFIVSRTNATGSSTGNLVHTTAPLVAGAIDVDSASIDSATITSIANTTFTGTNATFDSAVFSSGIQAPKWITPHFTFDSNNFFPTGSAGFDISNQSNNAKLGINMKNNTGNGSLSTDALAVKGDAYFLDYSGGFSIRLIPDQNPVVFRADNRTGASYAGINFKIGNGNPVNDLTVMKLSNSGTELLGDLFRTSGDMTFDMPADIILDADGGHIKFSDGGTQIGELANSSSDFVIESKVQDKDIIFEGDDGGSNITALTLDMSDAGTAIFNHDISLADNGIAKFGTSDDLQISHDGNNSIIADGGTGALILRSNNTVVQNAAGDENIAAFTEDGAVKLYFNDNLKFETTDSGVNVTGQLLADSATLTNLTVDSADIRQLSVDFINADSAFLDSATITNLAVGTLNIDNINIGDSATFTNVAVTTELNTNKLIVDDLTIDGSSIADAGDFTLNIEGDITLDANGADVKLSDDGLHFGTFSRSVNDLVIKSPVQDGDVVIKGNDGGSEITAMTIDMSEGGNVGIGTTSPTSKLHVKVGTNNNFEVEETGGDLRLLAINDARNANVPMEFAASQFEFITGDIITNNTVRVGNFNVDSADVITIAKNALSTGSPDALTYDSAAGQFALNANHVMALIQTVDSNGSGLNADTLEGQAGIYYRINVYNASGTLLN